MSEPSKVTVIPARRISEEAARAFAHEIHDRHRSDGEHFCVYDGMVHPCPDRQAADELLYGKAAS